MANGAGKKTIGYIGEDAVAAFLKRRGHRIITQNYRTYGGELDIVSVKRKTLVFTEVKTKRYAGYGECWEELTPYKKSCVKKAAYRFVKDECYYDYGKYKVPYYLHGLRFMLKYKNRRFDFAEVLLKGDRITQIIYTKNAF